VETPRFTVMKATLHVDLGFAGYGKSDLAKISRQDTTFVAADKLIIFVIRADFSPRGICFSHTLSSLSSPGALPPH
jgi:hypothetical protein